MCQLVDLHHFRYVVVQTMDYYSYSIIHNFLFITKFPYTYMKITTIKYDQLISRKCDISKEDAIKVTNVLKN